MKAAINRLSTIVIAYSAVIIVFLQCLANCIYFIDSGVYMANSFWLNFVAGTNGVFPVILLCMAFKFRLCSVSRVAAVAECLMALYYAIVQRDDLYNILVQLTLGVGALVSTVLIYANRTGTRRGVTRFIVLTIFSSSCERGLHKYFED
jgi:hypothetical protein